MRKKNKIEIQQPPLEEFTKKRSCLKRSCLSGCGCIIFVIIGLIILIKIISVPKPKKVNSIPTEFPENIIVYDKDTIDSIKFLSANKKNRNIENLAVVPKIILSPILVTFDKYTDFETQERLNIKNIKDVIEEPLGQYTDTTKIEWSELTAEPNFIKNFYIQELENKNYKVKLTKDTNTQKKIIFQSESTFGSITITDDPKIPGTDSMSLTVDTKIK